MVLATSSGTPTTRVQCMCEAGVVREGVGGASACEARVLRCRHRDRERDSRFSPRFALAPPAARRALMLSRWVGTLCRCPMVGSGLEEPTLCEIPGPRCAVEGTQKKSILSQKQLKRLNLRTRRTHSCVTEHCAANRSSVAAGSPQPSRSFARRTIISLNLAKSSIARTVSTRSLPAFE